VTRPLPALCHEAILDGRVDEADAMIAQMLAEKTVNPAHVLELRVALLVRVRAYAQALEVVDDLLRLGVRYFGSLYNRGQVLHWLGRFEESAAAYREALQFDYNSPLAWMRLGHVNLVLDRWPESLACYERSIALKPDDHEVHMAYACWMQMHDDNEGAERMYRRSLELARGPYWEVRAVQRDMAYLDGTDAVIATCGEAVRARPDSRMSVADDADEANAFEAEAGLGFVLLRQGKWIEGWRRFEVRWRMFPHGARWDHKGLEPFRGRPEDLDGKRVLLHAEQGFGDTIHFARYAKLVAERAAIAYLTAPESIRGLLSTMDAVRDGRVIMEGQDLPDPEVRASLMTLPRVFGTHMGNVPEPCVFRVEKRVLGPRIGVCWHGGSRPDDPLAHDDDERRSIPRDLFFEIVDASPAPPISLQEEDLREWGVEDWIGTAQIVAGLDLVISVDTAVLHLAGSLGIPTIALMRAGGCWRWCSTGSTTPWYRGMTLVRQPRLGDWRTPVAEVVRMLKDRTG